MSQSDIDAMKATLTQIAGRTDNKGPTIQFHGEPEENYADFKAAAEFELMFIEGDQQLRSLTRMLGIKPKVSLVANKPRTGAFTDIDQIWSALDATYGDNARADRATTELEKLRQGATPLAEFNYKFEKLCAEAGVTGTLRARIYRDKVVAGIGDRLRTAGLTDFQEMKERASIVAGDAERDYKRIVAQKKPKGRDEKGRYNATNIDQRDVTCWNCQKKGHMSFNCEEEVRPNRGPRGRGRRPKDTEMSFGKTCCEQGKGGGRPEPTSGSIEELEE